MQARGWRSLLVFLTLLPMLTSNVVRTFAWIVILGRQGPVSQTLVSLGFFPAPRSLLFNETAVVVVLSQIELPLLILPIMAVMSRADRASSPPPRRSAQGHGVSSGP